MEGRRGRGGQPYRQPYQGRGRGRGQGRYRGQEQNHQRQEEGDDKKLSQAVSDLRLAEPLGTSRMIVGTCMEMCPRSEALLREREGLLHKFEIIPGSDLQPLPQGQRGQGRGRKALPSADYGKVVKSFARSAAGQDKTVPEELRPIQALNKTVKYLNDEILTRTDTPFNIVYDFVFDRLRSVRQDLVIQRIEDEGAIRILEAVVKFHVYADFRLRHEDVSVYDPHINQKHLQDCLRKLIKLYEFNNYVGPSRAEFEALNCLVFISSYDVLSRAVGFRAIMTCEVLNISINMALAYQSHNFVRFFRILGKLPVILQMYCGKYVAATRRLAFEVFSSAYGVNSCKIPLTWITKLLLYPTVADTHRDLGALGVEIIRDDTEKATYAKFLKSQLPVIKAKSDVNSNFYSPLLTKFFNDSATSI